MAGQSNNNGNVRLEDQLQMNPIRADNTDDIKYLVHLFAITHGVMFTGVATLFSKNSPTGFGTRIQLNLLSVLVSAAIILRLLLIFFREFKVMRGRGQVMWFVVERSAIIMVLIAI